MPKINKKKVSILVIAIIVLYIVTEILPVAIDSVKPTSIVEYGNLIVEDEVTAFALRDETVYCAPSNGNINYIQKEGKLVKVGTQILEFEETAPDKEEKEPKYSEIVKRLGGNIITNPIETAGRKGVVSTYIDGYEYYFTEGNFENIKEKDALEKKDAIKDVKERSVKKNQPIIKITDQSHWSLVCWIEGGKITNYSLGNSIDVKFDETTIKFKVKDIVKEGDKWKVRLESNRFYEGFTNFRSKDVTLITTNLKGLIIDNKSLTSKDGNVGVMVLDNSGETSFVKVKVLATDGKRSVVAEDTFYDEEGNLINTVKIYDEIIKKPA